MSIRLQERFAIVPEWLLDVGVSASAMKLYVVLWRYADKEHRARPSRRKIAERMRCSVKTVDRSMTELEECGALAIRPRKAVQGDQDTNEYVLNVTKPDGGVGTTMSLPLVTSDEGVAPRMSPQDLREPLNENRSSTPSAYADEEEEPQWLAIRGLSDIQNGLLRKLQDRAFAWKRISPQLANRFRREYGGAVFTLALQHLQDFKGVPDRPEALLRAACEEASREAVS